VLPEARGRGLGRALWSAVENHVARLGVTALFTDTTGEEAGLRFASSRGFALDRLDKVSAVDPRKVDLAELPQRKARAAGAGYRLGTLRDVDLEAFYRMQLETADDMPGDESLHQFSFDEWRRDLIDHPDLSWDGWKRASTRRAGTACGRAPEPPEP
jgi:hypothetical protein